MIGANLLTGAVRARAAAIAGGVLLLMLAAALLWGWRLETLRARYAGALDGVMMILEPAIGTKVGRDKVQAGAHLVVRQRDQARRERDNAHMVVKAQSASIEALAAEGERLKALSAKDRALAEAMIRERDVWIKRAAAAETRTERKTCELELAEIEEVLDALYHSGF